MRKPTQTASCIFSVTSTAMTLVWSAALAQPEPGAPVVPAPETSASAAGPAVPSAQPEVPPVPPPGPPPTPPPEPPATIAFDPSLQPQDLATPPVRSEPSSGPSSDPRRDTPRSNPVVASDGKSFIGSAFVIQFLLGLGGSFGGLMSAESETEVQVKYSDNTTENVSPSQTEVSPQLSFEAAPLREDSWKLALRLGYAYKYVQQGAEAGDETHEQKKWQGDLVSADCVAFGPVAYFKLGNSSSPQFFASLKLLGGPVWGTLQPAAGFEEFFKTKIAEVDMNGWQVALGPGFGIAGSLFFGGIDITYTYTSVTLDQVVYKNVDKDTGYHTMGGSFFGGVHF